jgi:hypothetical protein
VGPAPWPGPIAAPGAPLPSGGRRRPGQVDEIRQRQAAGLIDPGLDPALTRLTAFALASYPRILRQITRMTTGTSPDDSAFQAAWAAHLRELGRCLAPADRPGSDSTADTRPG